MFNILVAEDEVSIRRLLKLELQQKSFCVFEAKDGVEALKIISNTNIDLAVLDVIMPKLDGFNLLREIRKISNIPVIFLTARGEEMDKVLGLGLGADDYLIKPFSTAELVARVEAQLRRRNIYDNNKEEVIETIQYKDLILDLKSCTLYKGDIEISLNAKEYKLLECLMKNPNKIFTKKQLYGMVWENDYCYDDNTIMVTISRLRNRIEEIPKNAEYIITVRGLGYKFNMQGK